MPAGGKVARNILVVDDSAIVRTQVRQKLEESGYHVVEAPDGPAALNYARTRAFDLVITDLHMPEMDGLALVEALRKTAEHKSIPILMLTTESDSDVVARGRSAGVTAWVTKPVRPEILLNGVRLVLPL
jgi:two-component system chemotaxis response regulator CheY